MRSTRPWLERRPRSVAEKISDAALRLTMTSPVAMRSPPKRKSGEIVSCSKPQPRSVPTTGCAKKVSEARPGFDQGEGLIPKEHGEGGADHTKEKDARHHADVDSTDPDGEEFVRGRGKGDGEAAEEGDEADGQDVHVPA